MQKALSSSVHLSNQTRVKKDWNSTIQHCTKLKDDYGILHTYAQMESLGIQPDNNTLPLIFKACARLKAVDRGRKIHSAIEGTHLVEDVRVGTSLIDFYSKCGYLEDARVVFNEMPSKDLVSWNAMISGYVSFGFYEGAILEFFEMQREGFEPNSRTLVQLILSCGEVLELRLGQEIHCYCLRKGLLDLDPHVGTALIGFYLKFDVASAQQVFDLMVLRSIVTWNAMINGHVEVGDSHQALNLFFAMLVDTNDVKFDSVTILSVVQACAKIGSFTLAMQIHQMALKSGSCRNNLFIMNALLKMYSDVGSLEFARLVFDTVPAYDTALWNSMMSVYNEYGYYMEATKLFSEMQTEGVKEDERSFAIMIDLCTSLPNSLKIGKSLHARAMRNQMKFDTLLGNAVLGMYSAHDCVDSVRKVFSAMSNVDEISYNTLMFTLVSNDMIIEAWKLLGLMRESDTRPNSYTVISVLPICNDENSLNVGKSIHGFAVKHGFCLNLSLNTALTEMYMNCGDEEAAQNLFDRSRSRDLISWNSLISSYIKNNKADNAMLLFNRMILEVEPNSVTIINILSSCIHVANLSQGQYLHAYVIRRDYDFDIGRDLSLANAFIAMYSRCGDMKSSERIFKNLGTRNVVTWNALISGYGMHGFGNDSIGTFFRMVDDGFEPNEVTFVSVLSACRHSGTINIGLQLFDSMVRDFKLKPELAHYGCVVDLLCREGRLYEAKHLIESMPIEPDATIWRALLSACRVHSDVKLAEESFEKLVAVEPLNAGNYVLLSNIYAAAGMWAEVGKVRRWMKEKGLRKVAGKSWIVIRNGVHCFSAGDTSHSESQNIYQNLNSLLSLLKDGGYLPHFSGLLHDEDDLQ